MATLLPIPAAMAQAVAAAKAYTDALERLAVQPGDQTLQRAVRQAYHRLSAAQWEAEHALGM